MGAHGCLLPVQDCLECQGRLWPAGSWQRPRTARQRREALRFALGGVLPAPGVTDCDALALRLGCTVGQVRRDLRDLRENVGFSTRQRAA